MKLYDIPRRSFVRVAEDAQVPPASHTSIELNDILFFDHIDGMYSFCINREGVVVHPAAWTQVEHIPMDEVERLSLYQIFNIEICNQ